MSAQVVRLAAVLALLAAAAALATPKGRLPLALRGMAKVLRGDRGTAGTTGTVSLWKRLLAFGLVLVAVALALIAV